MTARGRRVYIAGPMTGYDDFNYPAFHAAAEALQEHGFDTASPADTDGGSVGKGWAFYMRHDLRLLLHCDAVVTLPGWEQSRGASLEVFIACQLGMELMTLNEALALERVA